MKNLLLIFCFLGVLVSCSDDDDNTSQSLIGEWVLSEVNNDPGDGSGVFVKVESDKTLVFKENNEIVSNGSLCYSSAEPDSTSIATYELDKDSDTSGKILATCYMDKFPTFYLKDSKLYVSYFCDEYCGAIFIKK